MDSKRYWKIVSAVGLALAAVVAVTVTLVDMSSVPSVKSTPVTPSERQYYRNEQ